MSDMYSSSTSFEYLGDEDNNSEGSNGNVTSSLLNQYEKPNGSNEDTNVDIQSLTNSITSDSELWTFYEKEPMRDISESKSETILKCLLKSDSKGLRKLGRQKYGFVSDSLRRLVWPKITRTDIIETYPRPDVKQMESHPLYRLVSVDVNRAGFPSMIAGKLRESMVEDLKILVMRILLKNPKFNYYQGYHEVCQTFLLVLGEEMAFHVADSVSKTHFHGLLMDDGADKMLHLVQLTLLIVAEEEPKLGEYIEAMGHIPIFSLSWVTTWFVYNVKNYNTITRLFDLFLVSDPMLPVYLSAALILHKKDEILELECDSGEIHSLFNKMWSKEEDIPIEDLICNARSLMNKYVPEKLTELHATRAKQLSHRKQRSALSHLLNLVRKSSSLKLFSIPMAMVICAIIYQHYYYQESV